MAFTNEQLAQLMQTIIGNSSPFGVGADQFAREIQPGTKDQPYIGMVDPRTPGIKGLESVGLMQMFQSLLDPQWLANGVLSQTGQAPSRAAGDVGLQAQGAQSNPLMSMLFGGALGQGSTPWTPPGRGADSGGGAPPPAGGGTPPAGGAPPAGPGGGTQSPGGGQQPPGSGDGFYTSDGRWLGITPTSPLHDVLTAAGPDWWKNPQAVISQLRGPEQYTSDLANWITNESNRMQAVQSAPDPIAGANSTNNASVVAPQFIGPRVGDADPTWQGWWNSLDRNTYGPWMQRNAGVYGMPTPEVDAKAAGGPLDPSAVTVVGEQGPEAIVPGPGGQQQVVPINEQIMQMLLSMGSPGMAEGGILANPILDQTIVNSQAPTAAPGLIQPPTDPAGGGQIPGGGLPGGGITGNPGQFSGVNQPGALGQAAAFNPELDAFNSLKNAIGTGWGSQANTAFNLGQGMLGTDGSQGDANAMRSLSGGSFVTPEIQQSLTGQLTQNPGQGVMNALQPVWQQNLQSAFGQLQSSAPSVFNSAQQLQGHDLARSALNDFNLLSSQALQQGVGQQQNAASILGQLLGQNKQMNLQGLSQAGALGQGNAQALGQLGQGAAGADMSALQTLLGGAQSAGQGQFGRLNQAAQTGMANQQQGEQARQFNLQYDLAAQNQAYNQQMTPTLQLLLAAMGLAEPTGLQTVVGSQKA